MSEINEKEIERRFEAISKFEPDPEVVARDLKRTREKIIQKMNEKQKTWRIIMYNKKIKLAAAAVIIIAVLFSIFQIGGKDAYAIDQTIDAMRKVTTAHCLGKTFNGEQIEMWIEVNPETGENDKVYINSPEITIVATQKEAYEFQKNKNTVIKGAGKVSSDIRFGRFIEDMVKVARSDDSAEIKINEIESEKPVIILVIETDKMILECKVDSDTKLPISMHEKSKGNIQSGKIDQSIDEIYYNKPLPEGIFEFKIPEGAKVVEQ